MATVDFDTLERIEERHARLVAGLKSGSQTLMVAHEAALLAMITTYVQPGEPPPLEIHQFLRIFVTGLYFGIVGTGACLFHTIAWDRLHVKDKGHQAVFLACSVLMIIAPGISVILLFRTMLLVKSLF